MKIFENKKIFKKLLTFFISLTIIFSISTGTVSSANDSEDENVGGKLLKPVVDLVVGLSDGLYNIIHRITINQDDTLVHVIFLTKWQKLWHKVKTVLVFAVIAIAVAALIFVTAGIGGAILAPIATAIGVSASVTVSAGTVFLVSVAAGAVGAFVYNSQSLPDRKMYLPMYSISPEEIFSNKLQMFDVDFFHPNETVTFREEMAKINGVTPTDIDKTLNDNKISEEDEPDVSSAKRLRNTVGKWFLNLRDLALVVSLSVLVYTGIRIMISSSSKDQAKYKQLLIDWLVGFCLIFLMHFIMSFSTYLTKKFIDLASASGGTNYTYATIPDKDGRVSETLTRSRDDGGLEMSADSIEWLKDESGNKIPSDNQNHGYIMWKTNLIGIARLNAQMHQKESATYAGYAIMFLAMVLMTAFFIFTYLKRLLYMAFLTIISPLVAMTYPIDKMNDGIAQAFNMWLREYIFNLLIQPFHLLLYLVLVKSAFELASQNMVYAIVALGFMAPAEKLLRKFFGFEKSQTAGAFEGAAGAGAAMAVVNRLTSKANGKKIGDGSGSGSSSDNDNSIRFRDVDRDNLWGDGGAPASDGGAPGSSGNSSSRSSSRSNDIPNASPDKYDTPIENRIKNKAKDLKDKIKNDAKKGPAYQTYLAGKEGLGNLKNNASSKYNKFRASHPRYARAASGSKRFLKNRAKTIKNSRTMQGLGAGAKFYARGLANKATEKAKNMHPLKNSIRFAGGAVGAATLGAVGLAAGVVSGDPSKALQYTLAAGAGGAKLGSDIGSAVTVEGAGDTFNKAYYGEDEYKLRQVEKKYKELNNDKNFMKQLTDQFGSEEQAKTAMEEVGLDAISYGFTDAKEIAAIYKATSLEGLSTEKAIQTLDYVKTLGKDTSMLGNKDSQDLNDTLIRKVHEANPNKGSGEVANQAGALRKSFDRMSQFYFQGRKK